MRFKTLLSLAPLGLLVGCGWVDSTGRESNSAPVTQISFSDGQPTEATQIDELKSVRIVANGTDADGRISSYQWSGNPVRQGPLSECAATSDFDINIAASSLSEACATDSGCVLSIEQVVADGEGVEFEITAPDISAPVGLTYELTATDNDGGAGKQLATFCLIAINMAPEALDDAYTVLEGETLDVNTAARSLLSNDTDDQHVLNKTLTVLVEPKRRPSLASQFVLRSDGGFTYTPSSVQLNTNTTDTFEYWITDGVHDPVSATASVRIVAKDDPPEQIDDVPVLEATAGIPFEFDMSPFFEDPEGGTLSFAVVGGSLPQSRSLVLSSTGILSGTAELFDEGSYTVTVAASDGSSGVTGIVELVVIENMEVDALGIPAQTADVGVEFKLNVSAQFDDPENQLLSYSVDTEYDDAELSMNARTGVLTATFEDDGRYTVDVSADDGVTQPTSIRFVVNVTLDNISPIFRGTIASQSVDEDDLIEPIRGVFFDADSDTLEYGVVGRIPLGLSLSTTGVLSGRPTQSGRFSGIRIVATDPFGAFAQSNAFTISVVALPIAAINTAPVFVEDTVFNQGISLGQSITPVRPEFIDAESDSLSYSLSSGTLPVGVRLSATTGVVSGTPSSRVWERGLEISATDPSGASVSSDEFWIRVR